MNGTRLGKVVASADVSLREPSEKPRVSMRAVRQPGRPWALLLTGLLISAAAVVVTTMVVEAPTARFGWDFRYQYFPGAQAVADGRPLYIAPDDPTLQRALEDVTAYVYPPQLAVALAPFASASVDIATLVALLASLAAIAGALALVGVRDFRVYAATFVWWPTWTALAVVNLTSFLALAIALAWRYRQTLWPLAATLGVAASTKIFLWPMFVWLAAMRRWRPAIVGALLGSVLTLGTWAVIGFQGFLEYPALLRELTDMHYDDSYSIAGMASELGFDQTVGRALTLVIGGALVLWCIRLARQADDLRAFTCAILAAMALTPIVWAHYLLLLLAPLALVRPRFSAIWLVPVLLWASPAEGNGDGVQPFLPALATICLAVVILERPRRGIVVAEAPA
jgi:hypothetical protein